MKYQLIPSDNNIVVVPLKPKEVKEYTQKVLTDTETSNMDVIQYGRVVISEIAYRDIYKPGDVVLYQKLASHKTNFGDPRQVIVPIEYIQATLKELK